MTNDTADNLGSSRLPVKKYRPMKKYTVRLTEWHESLARHFGSGNLSEGVRKALDHYAEMEDWT